MSYTRFSKWEKEFSSRPANRFAKFLSRMNSEVSFYDFYEVQFSILALFEILVVVISWPVGLIIYFREIGFFEKAAALL